MNEDDFEEDGFWSIPSELQRTMGMESMTLLKVAVTVDFGNAREDVPDEQT